MRRPVRLQQQQQQQQRAVPPSTLARAEKEASNGAAPTLEASTSERHRPPHEASADGGTNAGAAAAVSPADAAAPIVRISNVEHALQTSGAWTSNVAGADASTVDSRTDAGTGRARGPMQWNGRAEGAALSQCIGAADGAVALNGTSQPKAEKNWQDQHRRRLLTAKTAPMEANKTASPPSQEPAPADAGSRVEGAFLAAPCTTHGACGKSIARNMRFVTRAVLRYA